VALVLPAWLSEVFKQQRQLPFEAFTAMPAENVDQPSQKRQRTGEAMYAWQPEASTKLEELAVDSRTKSRQSKANQRVSEGLRIAEKHCAPSRCEGS